MTKAESAQVLMGLFTVVSQNETLRTDLNAILTNKPYSPDKKDGIAVALDFLEMACLFVNDGTLDKAHFECCYDTHLAIIKKNSYLDAFKQDMKKQPKLYQELRKMLK